MINKYDIKYYTKYLDEKSDLVLLFGTMNEVRDAFQLPRAIKNTMSLDVLVSTVVQNGEIEKLNKINGYDIETATYKGVRVFILHRDGILRYMVGL